MKKANVIQFGVQIQYVRKQEEGAKPVLMVVSPDGRVLAVDNDFSIITDVLIDLARSIEKKSDVNTDN